MAGTIIGAIRTGWILLWAMLATLALFLPMTAAALLSRTGNLAFSISKLWARVMLRASCVSARIKNREKIARGQSYIIISNHQSHYDILALVTTLGIQFRWVIKKELLKIPLFGYALYAARNIFIDRSDPKKAMESIRRGLDRLPRGAGVMFFAEGTRSPDGRIREFKKGGFVMAMERGLPLLPVAVKGSSNVLPKGALTVRPGLIEVAVGDPIPSAGYSPERLDELIAKTREAVIEKLRD